MLYQLMHRANGPSHLRFSRPRPLLGRQSLRPLHPDDHGARRSLAMAKLFQWYYVVLVCLFKQTGCIDMFRYVCRSVCMHVCITKYLPVVTHKAVAVVSKLGNYRRGALLRRMDGRANSLMDRKVIGAVFFGMVAVVTSPTIAGRSTV